MTQRARLIDALAVLALVALMLLGGPVVLALLHEGQARPEAPTAVAYVPPPAPTVTPLRSPTPLPSLGPSPGPTATVFILQWPTPNIWKHQPPAELVGTQTARRHQ